MGFAGRIREFLGAPAPQEESGLAERVKRKLGPSWFTKRVDPARRRRVLRSLEPYEAVFARKKGWL